MRKPADLNEEQCDQIGGNDASDQSHMVCSEAATDHVNERLNNRSKYNEIDAIPFLGFLGG
jgi:hypothetical protein